MTSTRKKKPVGDVTSTVRAKAHLKRLDAANGKRLVVDLDVGAAEALKELLASGYGKTQKDVVIKALLDASTSLKMVS